MIRARLAPALALGVLLHGGDGGELRVIRTTPSAVASPASSITITFDRPVAGSLDYTVAAESIVTVSPALEARVEWRDPVTIRISPRTFLAQGTTYTVTVANSFHAMDGSKLAKPYQFSFRVAGATALTGSPAGPDHVGLYLSEKARFEVVYSAPVDSLRLSNAASLGFSASCPAPGDIRLRVIGQRPIDDKDDWRFREAGGWQRARAADSLRRVVALEPLSPLPLGCNGVLRVPMELSTEATSGLTAWEFAVHGALRIEKVGCGYEKFCATGPVGIQFSTPVRGSEVARHVRIEPRTPVTVYDSARESPAWELDARLKPHTTYTIVADSGLRDIFGQQVTGNASIQLKTTGFEPGVDYPSGRLLVERTGFGTLAIQSINVDTLVASIIAVPDTAEAGWLARNAWGYRELWMQAAKASKPTVVRLAVNAPEDRGAVTRLVLPMADASVPHAATLYAVKISGRKGGVDVGSDAAVALVQVTDLGVHTRLGVDDAVVWVTGVNDGRARAGAAVTLYDANGAAVATATTDATGLARLRGFRRPKRAATAAEPDEESEEGYQPFEGYAAVVLGADRAVAAVSAYDADLNPYLFNVSQAYSEGRARRAAAIFTERGIYRPTETVYAKAIVRDGALGALTVPPRGDSIRWVYRDRERGILKSVTTPLSAFGTASQRFTIPERAQLGTYLLELERKRAGSWRRVAATSYLVAEYRPPEFLVQVSGDSADHFPGDTLRAVVQARYLFGAPMGRAVLHWTARRSPIWWINIPGADEFTFGEQGYWWEEGASSRVAEFASGTDTLDLTGHRALAVALPEAEKGRASSISVEAVVTDVNRQVVGATTTTTMQPASFYVGVHALGDSWFWTDGKKVQVDVIAVRSDGTRLPGIKVDGTIVRREWNQVRRDRNGVSELVGEWVSDTVGHCGVTTEAAPVKCEFTPTGGGEYTVTFRALDERKRAVVTSIERWATGRGWVPWSDESQFKMDVIPDKARYAVGDTAHVLFASPFVNAEAWVTVEREGVIQQRRMRLTSGATRLDFPITEAFAPNVFVSIVVTRGRSAPPKGMDDPGRPTIRVGYAELRVTPEVKRLKVEVKPEQAEYRPGDSARVRLSVHDAQGRGRRSEVTLWAVDEGVLALTGYKTPDPIDLLYAPRGLGMRLASNLVAVAPQIPEGLKGQKEPGGGGGMEGAAVLRSRFRTTAFFIGSVITDTSGSAVAVAKLPDNLTTFRVMAVAVTAGDRFGDGESPMLVTQPLLARPALPRFVRATDQFAAGAVINSRSGGTPTVTVSAEAQGIAFTGDTTQRVRLEQGRGREVRFGFRALPGAASITPGTGDSATFRFRVTDSVNADAVQRRVPIRPEYHPRSYTIAGVLRDTATESFVLPADIDPARSRLTLSVGMSPLTLMRGIWWQMTVYPYDCTEQVSSEATVAIALYRVQKAAGGAADAGMRGDPKREIEKAVEVLSARQRTDGGIGYWSPRDWTTPWLSAYAGSVLLDAKRLGVAVDDSVLARVAAYLTKAMREPTPPVTPVSNYYDRRYTTLSDQLAAAEFLSRMGRSDVPTENSLIRSAAQMSFEDRARLAEMVARRGDLKTARELLAPEWAAVTVEGRHATLADTTVMHFYFRSDVRPMARLLTATLAVDPANRLVGPMVETMAQAGHLHSLWYWNTQDLASAAAALAAFERATATWAARHVRVRSGTNGPVLLDIAGRTGPAVVVTTPAAARRALSAPRDSTVPLTGLLSEVRGETRRLTLSLDTPGDTSSGAAFYFLSVTEVPLHRPVTPDQAGIQVERWYEDYESGKPVTSAVEGSLVRVRLRLRVPADREFVVLEDPLPAGLEAVDLSLRTSALGTGPGAAERQRDRENDVVGDDEENGGGSWWYYGWWDGGWWSPFDHREMHDDRVVYSASWLWQGTWTASYIARATTPGVFVRPPAYAEEMYDPAVHGRSDGGVFTVTAKTP